MSRNQEHRKSRRASTSLCAIALLIGLQIPAAHAQSVLIKADDTSPPYRTIIEEIIDGLKPGTRVIVDTPAADMAQQEPDLLVALGSNSNQQLADAAATTPLFSLLLTRSSYQELASRLSRETPKRQHSGLFLELSLQTQVQVARRVFPQLQEFGLLYADPATFDRTAVNRLPILARRYDYDGNLILSLRKLLPDIDALITVPDREVYNEQTIHTVLLSAYRLNRPVIGHARPYVAAGAIIAAYTPPALIGREAAAMISTWFDEAKPPAPRHPHSFSVSVNQRVAKVLGLQPRVVPAAAAVYQTPEAIR